MPASQMKQRRRRAILPLVAACSLAAAGCSSTVLSFVGRATQVGRSDLTLRAAEGFSGKKQKQRLSLTEALERQKKKALEEAEEEKEKDKEKREEAKLAPEQTFWEGPPSSTELLFPFLASFAVLGIIPFISSVNRQFRVKYKITDQRVSVSGGLDGTDITEFSYQEVYEMKYGLRFFGYCADMRINLRDGAKVEMYGLLNFYDNYNFMLARIDEDAKKRSDPSPDSLE
eukprot:TRINITY_DN4552_c0_g1_i1.p1 TRINITY_DN4552_c0_g1~~TRINITY_DN4552_c0_g1_i1.p1  ORF type:complete len:229 (-),score=84.68 TRINITY_DN4552_c0_g1_i1:390-1076(-)